MSDESSKRFNRRRRRDRNDRRGGETASAADSAPAPAAPAAAPAPKNNAPSTGRPRRDEPNNDVLHRRTDRRRGGRPNSDSAGAGDLHPGLVAFSKGRAVDEVSISPIDKGIFIYTYTLRPRSLLDSYQPASGVTHRMQFEKSVDDD